MGFTVPQNLYVAIGVLIALALWAGALLSRQGKAAEREGREPMSAFEGKADVARFCDFVANHVNEHLHGRRRGDRRRDEAGLEAHEDRHGAVERRATRNGPEEPPRVRRQACGRLS
jgi:hypothetical protein